MIVMVTDVLFPDLFKLVNQIVCLTEQNPQETKGSNSIWYLVACVFTCLFC